MSLTCSTDANPDADVYQFYFNDSLIGNSSSGVFNVTVDKDGVYSCVPINKVGTGHNATVSITSVGESVNEITIILFLSFVLLTFTNFYDLNTLCVFGGFVSFKMSLVNLKFAIVYLS